jgi:hypothetical protein
LFLLRNFFRVLEISLFFLTMWIYYCFFIKCLMLWNKMKWQKMAVDRVLQHVLIFVIAPFSNLCRSL